MKGTPESRFSADDPGPLVRACIERDKWACRFLVDLYSDLVYSVPRKLGLDREWTEDVFQTVWTAVFDQLEGLRDPNRLKSWLLSITYRQTKAAVKKVIIDRPTDLSERTDRPDLVTPPVATEMLEALDRRRLVADAMEELDEPCRNLLGELYLREEKASYAELSKRLGMPMGSVGPNRSRCLARLKKIISRIRGNNLY